MKTSSTQSAKKAPATVKPATKSVKTLPRVTPKKKAPAKAKKQPLVQYYTGIDQITGKKFRQEITP